MAIAVILIGFRTIKTAGVCYELVPLKHNYLFTNRKQNSRLDAYIQFQVFKVTRNL